MKKELVFEELGLFTDREAKNICEVMNGATYYNFDVKYGNYPCKNNATIIATIDVDDNEDLEEVRKVFIATLIRKLAVAFNRKVFD